MTTAARILGSMINDLRSRGLVKRTSAYMDRNGIMKMGPALQEEVCKHLKDQIMAKSKEGNDNGRVQTI